MCISKHFYSLFTLFIKDIHVNWAFLMYLLHILDFSVSWSAYSIPIPMWKPFYTSCFWWSRFYDSIVQFNLSIAQIAIELDGTGWEKLHITVEEKGGFDLIKKIKRHFILPLTPIT